MPQHLSSEAAKKQREPVLNNPFTPPEGANEKSNTPTTKQITKNPTQQIKQRTAEHDLFYPINI
jgi:hypothetical protein